jgi:uncharacterized LabA/DUF88 family protein
MKKLFKDNMLKISQLCKRFYSKKIIVNSVEEEQENSVGVYVDIDNVVGQLDSYIKPYFLENLYQVLIQIGREYYDCQVCINVYGNLEYHGLSALTFESENITVVYIDTPVINNWGKTLTDTRMVVDMMININKYFQTVLVTCDVDFEPVAEHFNVQNQPIDIIKFGHTHHELLKYSRNVIDGHELLAKSSILPISFAKELLVNKLKESDNNLPLATASHLLSGFRANKWQGCKTFANFIKSLHIPNMIISPEHSGVLSFSKPLTVDESVDAKLKDLGLSTLSTGQYRDLFKAISKCELGLETSKLVEHVHQELIYSKEFEKTHIEKIVTKLLPYLNKQYKPSKLASLFRDWLVKKSTVVGSSFNSSERIYLSTLIKA